MLLAKLGPILIKKLLNLVAISDGSATTTTTITTTTNNNNNRPVAGFH